ncbi:hypothetical protein ABMA28_009674 [Loxostege sticticalis]|uniref:Uncharacterized protein n=1 Tax=Loxostege sticticalis TaxID=481309 RepID=A0ABD0SB22_LOXSC
MAPTHLGCAMELVSSDTCSHVFCEMRALADSARRLLVTLFQIANVLLLIASVFENALLVDIYMWYTLGYIAMGFVVAIYEFVVKTKRDGFRSLVTFVPEVVFLFVVFRCLPLVDLYRRHLYSTAAISLPI